MTSPHTLAVLSALGSEMAAVRIGIEDLADLVSVNVRTCPPEQRQRALSDAQAINVLTQRLDALCGFANALAHNQTVDAALAIVPLADLANRLRASIHSLPEACGTTDVGDLDLFD